MTPRSLLFTPGGPRVLLLATLVNTVGNGLFLAGSALYFTRSVGLSVTQAIESLGRRADAPNMNIFVRSITQGERLGVSIATTMRNLSLEMRKRRRAMAEERAQKMPIKMLFPLIFFIFPALFIVILTPMIINIVDALC